MIYLGLSVLCSTFMILLFKWFPKYGVDNFQAIVINYYICILTGLFFTPPSLAQYHLLDPAALTWLLPAMILGTLFVSLFPLIGRSIQQYGATVTTIAGRTSMVMPIGAAIYLYGDSMSLGKLLGVLAAVLAIFFTALHPNPTQQYHEGELHLGKRFELPILPFVVFLGNGIIEIIFNHSRQFYVHETEYELFTIAIFSMAALIGSVRMLGKWFVGNVSQRHKQNLLAGIILGVPNYFSAYFFLLALEKSNLESSKIIPLNSIGIVVLASVGALLLFSEKLSRLNIVGIGLAVAAIWLISSAG